MIIWPGLRRGVSATQRLLNSTYFYAPRTSSITQTRGAGTPTETRATVATVMGYAADAVLADGQTLLTVASGELRFQGARRVSEGVWSTVDADGAPIPAATLKGAVVEDLTAYLALHAETFNDAAWSKANSSVTTNAGVAPDGTTTAENLIEDTVLTAHSAIHSVTLVDNTNYINGIFAKAGTRTWCVLGTTNKANQTGFTYFNLSTGAFGTVDALHTNHGSVALVNGWYFLWVKYGSSAGATAPTVRVELANGNNGRSYTGDNVSYATFWGAMGHIGEYPRSYMTTAAAAVTRNADIPDDQVSGNLTAAAGSVAFQWTPSHAPSGTVALCGSYVDASNYTMMLAQKVTNGVANSTDLTVAGGGWTATCTVAAGVADPLGGTTAYTLTATGASQYWLRTQNNAITGDKLLSSIWIRRRTGTGTISLYTDTGAANALSGISASWQRLSDAVRTATGTNNYFGVQIATSGDAVDIWRPQGEIVTNQVSQFAGPYVATTTAAASNTFAIFRKVIAGAAYDAYIQHAYVSGTTYDISLRWGASGSNLAVDGVLGTAHANTTAAQLSTRWQWGADGNGGQQAGAAFKEMYLTPRTLSDSELQAITV